MAGICQIGQKEAMASIADQPELIMMAQDLKFQGDAMTEGTAACSCGQLTVKCDGEPVRVSICHCLAFQRLTGSVFGEQARFKKEDIKEISGRSTLYVRVGDTGSKISFHFCPNCGATVYYTINIDPDLVAIPVGAFADPKFQVPTGSVYESRKHDWVNVPEGPDVVHLD
jgi:hypothetical protein